MTGDEYHYLKTYKVTNSVLLLFITTFFFLGSSKFAYEYIPAGATHVVVWRRRFLVSIGKFILKYTFMYWFLPWSLTPHG